VPMKNYSRLVFFLVVLFFVLQVDLQAQCAMCKQAAESSMRSNPNSMARSLNSGILYLMAVPYLMIAFIFRKQLFGLWKKLQSRFKKQTL
jgi:hypothetical protein